MQVDLIRILTRAGLRAPTTSDLHRASAMFPSSADGQTPTASFTSVDWIPLTDELLSHLPDFSSDKLLRSTIRMPQVLFGFYYWPTSYKGQPFFRPLSDLFRRDSIGSNLNFFQNYVSSSVAKLFRQQISTTDGIHPSFYGGRPPFGFHPGSYGSRTSSLKSYCR